MRNNFCLAAGVCVAALLPAAAARAQQPATMKIEAPEITGIQEWLNSKPLKLKDLRGKMVVLHFSSVRTKQAAAPERARPDAASGTRARGKPG